MAQLRDAQTSQIIMDGSPLQVALAAQELGPDEVLFDDVGEGFDPAAVIQAHTETSKGLSDAVKDANSTEKTALQKAVKDHDKQADISKLVGPAQDNLQAARDSVDTYEG